MVSVNGGPSGIIGIINGSIDSYVTPIANGELVIDPTGTVVTCVPKGASPTYDYFTPLTGAIVQVANSNTIINPAGTIAALTVNLPASPTAGSTVNIKFSQVVTALTLGFGTNSAVGTPATASTVGLSIKYFFDTNTSKWFPN